MWNLQIINKDITLEGKMRRGIFGGVGSPEYTFAGHLLSLYLLTYFLATTIQVALLHHILVMISAPAQTRAAEAASHCLKPLTSNENRSSFFESLSVFVAMKVSIEL